MDTDPLLIQISQIQKFLQIYVFILNYEYLSLYLIKSLKNKMTFLKIN